MNITESRDYNIALTMSRTHANITQLTKNQKKCDSVSRKMTNSGDDEIRRQEF